MRSVRLSTAALTCAGAPSCLSMFRDAGRQMAITGVPVIAYVQRARSASILEVGYRRLKRTG